VKGFDVNVNRHLKNEVIKLQGIKKDMQLAGDWVSAWPNAQRIEERIVFYKEKLIELE
tara:strand:+ start:166 stop:339 length:174 start_codon:yes stop_codon:yes gene_type:complete